MVVVREMQIILTAKKNVKASVVSEMEPKSFFFSKFIIKTLKFHYKIRCCLCTVGVERK